MGLESRVGLAEPLPPDVAASYLSSAGGRVLIVPAGDYLNSLTLAQILEDALVRSHRPDEVRTDTYLGRTEQLTDPQIVSRFLDQPVDEVIVVRALSSESMGSATFYDLTGKRLAAFYFGPDVVPVARGDSGRRPDANPNPPPTTGNPPVSPNLAVAPTAPAGTDEASLAEQRARRSFETGYLSIRDVRMTRWVRRRRTFHRETYTVTVASQGDSEEIIPWELLYEQLHRPDLLDQYQDRQVLHSNLRIVGGVSMLISLPLFVGALVTGFIGTDKRIPYSLAGVGGGLLIAGTIPLSIGTFRWPQPLSRDGIEQLIDAHNQALRQRFAPPSTP